MQLQLLGSARAAHSVVVVPTSTDPMGILKSTREFKAPGAGKEHNCAVRGGGRDPGVRRPGSGLGRPTVRSKFFRAAMHSFLFIIPLAKGYVIIFPSFRNKNTKTKTFDTNMHKSTISSPLFEDNLIFNGSFTPVAGPIFETKN